MKETRFIEVGPDGEKAWEKLGIKMVQAKVNLVVM